MTNPDFSDVPIVLPTLGLGPDLGTLNNVTGGIGGGSIGGGSIGGQSSYSLEIATVKSYPETEAYYHSGWGHGIMLGRGYLHYREVYGPAMLPISDDAIEITFYSRDRAVLGRVRSDVQRSTILALTRVINAKGSKELRFELSDWPDFPIVPKAIVGLRVGRSRRDHFTGSLQVDALRGTTRESYEFEAKGLGELLDKNSINAIIEVDGTRDVGDIAREIIDDYILPRTKITFSPAKVTEDTGTIVINDLDFDRDTVADALQNLADMCGFETGVDEEGDIFFREPSDEILGVFAIGHGNITFFHSKLNIEDVVNSVVAKRAKSKAEGGAGWLVATVQNDEESQAKYDFRQKIIKISASYDNDLAVLIATTVLDQLKDPQQTATAKILITGGTGMLKCGLYRFIAGLDDYEVELSEFENTDNFSKTGSGDLTFTVDNSTYMSGGGSMRLNWEAGNLDVLEYILTEPQRIGVKKILFYLRGPRLGTYVRFGIGETAWNEHTRDISIDRSNAFAPVVWDVSDLNPILGRVGWQILDTSGQPGKIYIDRMTVVVRGYRHFDLRMVKITDKLRDGKFFSEVELGSVPAGFGEYLQNLYARSVANEFTAEDRTP